VPVQGRGRWGRRGGQGHPCGGKGVGGLALAGVLVAPEQVALGGDRHSGQVHRAALADSRQERHVRAEQLPEAGSDHGVRFRHGHAGTHQAGRGAVRGLEHRVDLGLHGGRVFLHVDAERQQTAGGRTGHRHVCRAG
jgi:hypothetical protein